MQNGLTDDADRDEVVEEEEEYFDNFDENDYMEEQLTHFPTFDDEENINHQSEEEEEDYLQSLQPLSQVEHRPSNFPFTYRKTLLPSPEPFFLSFNGLDK